MCKKVYKKGGNMRKKNEKWARKNKYRAKISPRGHLHCALAQFHAINNAPTALIRQSFLNNIESNLEDIWIVVIRVLSLARERLVTALPVMAKSWDPSCGNQLPGDRPRET
jgi:hypothetical protein